ncbi:hypothetical protein GCM10017556_10470 [Micromonospora sagamiensis]|nr:hypothetical protein GCM10017556_10470 [Micromonospora sagamiensis]
MRPDRDSPVAPEDRTSDPDSGRYLSRADDTGGQGRDADRPLPTCPVRHTGPGLRADVLAADVAAGPRALNRPGGTGGAPSRARRGPGFSVHDVVRVRADETWSVCERARQQRYDRDDAVELPRLCGQLDRTRCANRSRDAAPGRSAAGRCGYFSRLEQKFRENCQKLWTPTSKPLNVVAIANLFRRGEPAAR